MDIHHHQMTGPLTEWELEYLNPSNMDSNQLTALARAIKRQGNTPRNTRLDMLAMVAGELQLMEIEREERDLRAAMDAVNEGYWEDTLKALGVTKEGGN